MSEREIDINDACDLYLRRLEDHLTYVWTASFKLGIPREHANHHDISKYGPEEFIPYARQFCGQADKPDEFALAWLHHVHHNPHHWQHWMFPDEYEPQGSTVELGMVEMPRLYCVEMVADWLGASMAYTGSWDMTDWLWKNLSSVKLHSRSLMFTIALLVDIGYYPILIEIGYPIVQDAIPCIEPANFWNMKPWNEKWWEE